MKKLFMIMAMLMAMLLTTPALAGSCVLWYAPDKQTYSEGTMFCNAAIDQREVKVQRLLTQLINKRVNLTHYQEERYHTISNTLRGINADIQRGKRGPRWKSVNIRLDTMDNVVKHFPN